MCSVKTMGKILLGLIGLTLAGFLAFPQYRLAVYSLFPYLIFLACPLAMYLMMKSMNMPASDGEKKTDEDQRSKI